jgi:hypothetical protein
MRRWEFIAGAGSVAEFESAAAWPSIVILLAVSGMLGFVIGTRPYAVRSRFGGPLQRMVTPSSRVTPCSSVMSAQLRGIEMPSSRPFPSMFTPMDLTWVANSTPGATDMFGKLSEDADAQP